MDGKKIDALVKLAVEADLEGLDFLAQFTYAQLADAYNGIGPEFLPPAVRDRVTDFLSIFEAAALIHDLRNEYSDGTREGFLAANDEFLRNCLKCTDHFYYENDRERRDRAQAVANVLYAIVSSNIFGWRAWQEAKERHAKKLASGNSVWN